MSARRPSGVGTAAGVTFGVPTSVATVVAEARRHRHSDRHLAVDHRGHLGADRSENAEGSWRAGGSCDLHAAQHQIGASRDEIVDDDVGGVVATAVCCGDHVVEEVADFDVATVDVGDRHREVEPGANSSVWNAATPGK